MLSEQEKRAIVYAYTEMKIPQTNLAEQYNCSRKTIYRVLNQSDALYKRVTLTREERMLLRVLRTRKIDKSRFLRAIRLLDAEEQYYESKVKEVING